MTIRLRQLREPVPTSAWFQKPGELATAASFHRLKSAIARYVSEEISGRSFVIAGHRGAGKTTLVYEAIRAVRNEDPEGVRRMRPLLVLLNGPDLLLADTTLLLRTRSEEESAEHCLTQITIGLYKALVDELTRRFQAKVEGPPRRDDAVEIAAALRLELDGFPSEARLRSLWKRAGVFEHGALFEGQSRGRAQGLRELVALSSASQAFQLVSGQVSETGTVSRDDAREESARGEPTSQGLTTALVSVFAALATGSGAAAAAGEFGAVPALTAGLVGLGTSLGLSRTWSTSHKQSESRAVTFVRDRSLTSLSRMLPDLIQRVRDAGLAPVFVIDELDKVDLLRDRLAGLVRRMKHFVTERAFFCFLTDRQYFEEIEADRRSIAYSKDHTYYSDRLYVAYSTRDLAEFLDRLITLENAAAGEEAGAVMTRYALRFMARLHPFDLRNLVDGLRTEDNALSGDPARFQRGGKFPLYVLYQVAMEDLLQHDALAARLDGDPFFVQFAHDALYSLSRAWESGQTEFQLDRRAFENDLLSRSGLGRVGRPASPADPLPPQSNLRQDDITLLFEQVQALASYLADPKGFLHMLEQRPEMTIDPHVRSLLEIVDAPLERVQPDGYRWRYEFQGRRIAPPTLAARPDAASPAPPGAQAATVATTAVDAGRSAILAFENFLSAKLPSLLGPGSSPVSQQWLSDRCYLLPTSPPWSSVRQALQATDPAAPAGSVDTATIENAARDIEAYARGVRANLVSVTHALYAAHLLSLAAYGKETSVSLESHLQLTSGRLNLSSRSAADRQSRVAMLAESLATAFAVADPQVDDLVRLLSHVDGAEAVEVCGRWLESRVKEPRGGMQKDETLVEAAWRLWKQRFGSWFATARSPVDPDGATLICEVRKLGPSALLDWDFDRMTLIAIGRVLTRSLSQGSGAPPWLALPLLDVLGFRQKLKVLVEAFPEMIADAEAQSWVDAVSRGVPGDEDARAVLWVVRDVESAAEHWTRAVGREIVIPHEPAEALRAQGLLQPLLRALGVTEVVLEVDPATGATTGAFKDLAPRKLTSAQLEQHRAITDDSSG